MVSRQVIASVRVQVTSGTK